MIAVYAADRRRAVTDWVFAILISQFLAAAVIQMGVWGTAGNVGAWIAITTVALGLRWVKAWAPDDNYRPKAMTRMYWLMGASLASSIIAIVWWTASLNKLASPSWVVLVLVWIVALDIFRYTVECDGFQYTHVDPGWIDTYTE